MSLDYLCKNKIHASFETNPVYNEEFGYTDIFVDLQNDIALDKDSEDYKDVIRDVAVGAARAIFVRLSRDGYFCQDELATVLSDLYVHIRHDLHLSNSNRHHRGFNPGQARREFVLPDLAVMSDDIECAAVPAACMSSCEGAK